MQSVFSRRADRLVSAATAILVTLSTGLAAAQAPPWSTLPMNPAQRTQLWLRGSPAEIQSIERTEAGRAYQRQQQIYRGIDRRVAQGSSSTEPLDPDQLGRRSPAEIQNSERSHDRRALQRRQQTNLKVPAFKPLCMKRIFGYRFVPTQCK